MDEPIEPKSSPKGVSHYWQQVGSVVLGGIIAAAASGFVTYEQGRSQQKQFVLDKQLGVLKEYSSSFNQQAWQVLSDVKKLNATLFAMGNYGGSKHGGSDSLSEKELDAMNEEIFKIANETAMLGGNLSSQRTMVYALFGLKPDESKLEESMQATAGFQTSIMEAFKKTKTDLDRVKLMHNIFSEIESNLVVGIDNENEAIRELAFRIGESYRH